MNRWEAYQKGQDIGRQGYIPNPAEISLDVLGTFMLGWAVGWAKFQKPLASSLVEKPEWMSDEQFGSVVAIYFRPATIQQPFPDFFRKVENYGDYCGLPWSGMFLGIEKDGYTHS